MGKKCHTKKRRKKRKRRRVFMMNFMQNDNYGLQRLITNEYVGKVLCVLFSSLHLQS